MENQGVGEERNLTSHGVRIKLRHLAAQRGSYRQIEARQVRMKERISLSLSLYKYKYIYIYI